MKTFRNFIYERKNKVVELTTISDKKEASDAWAENLEYKGENAFKFYMKFLDWFEDNTEELKDTDSDCEYEDEEECEELIESEKQESYLGYIPSKDMFITGFDMWYGGANPAGVVYWKYLGKNKFKIVSEDIDYGSNMMYGSRGAYKKLHKKYKDLVDIRLD